MIVSTPLENVYVIWEPLAHTKLDLKKVGGPKIDGQVLTCSTLPSSQFGYSLAIYNGTSIMIGAPNATINNKAAAGIIFGIDIADLYNNFGNRTLDICSNAFRKYTWNITDSNAQDQYRLGSLMKGGKIYDNEALVFTEGSLLSHNKTIGVMHGLSKSFDFASLAKKNGFSGVFAKSQSTSFSSLEIGSMELGSANISVILIGCPDCTLQNIHSAGLVWSISPINQPKLSSIGKQDTIFNSGLSPDASFGISIGILPGNKIFIGAPYADSKGAVYTLEQPNTGSSSFRGNEDVNKTGGGILSNLINTSFGFLMKAMDNILMIGSPSSNNNAGSVDLLVNPHIQTSNVILSNDHSIADKHISLLSNDADRSMLGSGVMTFVELNGHKLIGLGGSNATTALIFDEPQC